MSTYSIPFDCLLISYDFPLCFITSQVTHQPQPYKMYVKHAVDSNRIESLKLHLSFNGFQVNTLYGYT